MKLTEQQKAVLACAREGHGWGDGWVEHEMEKTKDAKLGQTVCTGCTIAGCCKQPVLATWIDAFPIAVWFHGRGGLSSKTLKRYFELGHKMEYTLRNGTEDEYADDCVFLDKGKCVVYEIRPMICRAYYAFGDRANCTPYHEREDGERPMICALDHSPAIAATIYVATDMAGELKCPHARMPWVRALPLQVAILLNALELSPDAFWPEVWSQCHMPEAEFAQMAAVQQENPMKREAF